MAAIGCHVARVAFITVDSAGDRLNKATATNKQIMTANTEHRVLEDAAIASTADNPTVKQYIEREAALGYIVSYMDQNTVVTYLASDLSA